MKVLVLSHSIPYPLHDGYTLRIFNYARYLSPKHQFHLICFGENDVPAPLVDLFSSVQTILHSSSPIPEKSFLQRLDITNPDDLFPLCSKMQSSVDDFIANNDIDLVWASGWHMPIYAYRANRKVPIFGDFIDEDIIESTRALRNVRSPSDFLRGLLRIMRAWRFERRYFCQANMCNVVSDVDAAAVRFACPRTSIQCIPNGVDIDFFSPTRQAIPKNAMSLVFEGNMAFAPNVEAATWFVDQVWPRLRSTHPQIELTLVGKDPTPEITSLAAKDGIRVTGLVSDVRDYLATATAFVCPLRNGAGVKNKILQAWAMGIPVIASPVACSGLRAEARHNVLVARRSDEWITAIDQILFDPDLRMRIASAGRATAEEYYSWSHSAQLMDDAWKEMTRIYRLNYSRPEPV